jgi:hypothetical protein
MRNILAIAGKELRSLFVSPIAYVVLTAFSSPAAGFSSTCSSASAISSPYIPASRTWRPCSSST